MKVTLNWLKQYVDFDWSPEQLSERLTMHYGVILIGTCAILSLFYTGGNVDTLVTMYSINVFVTFSLSQLGMALFWWKKRREAAKSAKQDAKKISH